MKVKVTDFDTIANKAKEIMDTAVACYPLATTIDDPYLEGLLFIRIGQILTAMGVWYAQNFAECDWEEELTAALAEVLDASQSIGKLGYDLDDKGLWNLTLKIEALVEELADLEN